MCWCSNCVFLDPVFACLAAITHRAKQTAKVVYVSPVTRLLWAYKNYITNPPTNPDQHPQPPSLSLSYTHTHTKPIFALHSIAPGPGSDHLNAHSLPTLFKRSSPKRLTLSSVSLLQKHKYSGPCFLLSLSALGWPWCFRM